MARNQFFVRSSDMQGFAPALIDGNPAVHAYGRLIAHIAATAGPEAATLFAEPQLPRGWSGGAGTISWYSSLQGRVVPRDAIDHVTRSQFDQKVTERLRMLAPALADPALGPAVSTWLNIGGSGDILSVGGEPVLVNWGAAPSNVLTREQRAAHYAATLGQFAPQLPVPAGEAVLPPPARPTQASPAPGSGTGAGIGPRAPAQAAMAGSTAAPAAPSAASGTAQASPVSSGAAVTMQPAVRTSRGWTAPWIATGIAAVVLLLLSLPGVLVYPAPPVDTSARDAFEQQRLHASNESLEAQLRAIQVALDGKQCRPANLVVPVPDLPSDSSGSDGDKPSDTPQLQVQPAAPEKAQLPPGETRGREDATTVGRLLEKTTVLIVAFSSEGENISISQGSGFLISNQHVVTNHHVVEHVDASRVFVANKALGVVPARIVALSQPPPTETDVRTDIAVLEIEPQAGLTGLALGPTPPKLSTAYVAGYPGFLTERDSAFKSFVQTLARGAFSRDDVRQSMARDHIEVPGVDLEEGRINNSMRTGSRSLPILLHDMQLAKGNSGGPLVDACGRLIGINTALFASDAGTRQGNVAQDVTTVRGFLSEKGIAFVDEPQACEPQVAAAPAASPAPTAVKP
jgi:S1-C subfamily serine protease